MLFWLGGLSDGGGFLNLFSYITFRAGGAFATALLFGFIFGRPLIDLLRRKQGKGQPIRDDGPQTHFAKAGTPTMGGLLILSALLFSTLLWARLDNPYVWIVLSVTFAFGLIGGQGDLNFLLFDLDGQLGVANLKAGDRQGRIRAVHDHHRDEHIGDHITGDFNF